MRRRTAPPKSIRVSRTAPDAAAGRLLYVANWKMNLDVAAAGRLAAMFARTRIPKGIDVVACPSFPALVPVREQLRRSTVLLGAQDVSMHAPGAHTGDVSADDLRSIGCRYVLVGHSERRREHGETDEDVRRKVLAALAHHLSPIVCIGESQQDRAANRHMFVVMRQLQRVLHNLPPPRQTQELVVAYEPVWAISPGGPASPDDALQMASVIRQALVDAFGERVADGHTRVVYGGSVAPENVRAFVDKESIRGVLVGRESLEEKEFVGVLRGLLQH